MSLAAVGSVYCNRYERRCRGISGKSGSVTIGALSYGTASPRFRRSSFVDNPAVPGASIPVISKTWAERFSRTLNAPTGGKACPSRSLLNPSTMPSASSSSFILPGMGPLPSKSGGASLRSPVHLTPASSGCVHACTPNPPWKQSSRLSGLSTRCPGTSAWQLSCQSQIGIPLSEVSVPWPPSIPSQGWGLVSGMLEP